MKAEPTALTLALLAWAGRVTLAATPGTAFTSQVTLNDAGQPANGHHDLRFTLDEAVTAGTAPGVPPNTQAAVQRRRAELERLRYNVSTTQ